MKNLESDDFYDIKHDESAQDDINKIKADIDQKRSDQEAAHLNAAFNSVTEMIRR